MPKPLASISKPAVAVFAYRFYQHVDQATCHGLCGLLQVLAKAVYSDAMPSPYHPFKKVACQFGSW